MQVREGRNILSALQLRIELLPVKSILLIERTITKDIHAAAVCVCVYSAGI